MSNLITLYLICLLPMLCIIAVVGGIAAIILTLQRNKFKHSTYESVSGNSFRKVRKDKGCCGEYLTYRMLETLPEHYRLLTNVYLPKKDGKTTEIDILMIHPTGIYVFESKNYSGWIFGNEKDRMWTQSLKGGKKTKFYNPISQNKGHLKALDVVLEGKYAHALRSFIIFSERCELKSIHIHSKDVVVIKRNHLLRVLYDLMGRSSGILDHETIEGLYNQLRPYTQVDEVTKERHIANIRA